jgi:poly(A) polymerase
MARKTLLLKDEGGRILRDNRYGTIDDDIWRRDFTANSLYYNIADFSIWDYCGGVEDIRAGVLRLIGEPEARYREDPVRLLRAARFAAKLGFRLDPATEAPVRALAPTLEAVPPARLFDEVLKLFLGGHSLPSYELLRRYGLFGQLFPEVNELLDSEAGEPYRALLLAALQNTDQRVADDEPVTPCSCSACCSGVPCASGRRAWKSRAKCPCRPCCWPPTRWSTGSSATWRFRGASRHR